jgi:hypothetical protein
LCFLYVTLREKTCVIDIDPLLTESAEMAL